MFIRRARTRNKATGEAYFTHRLVASLRAGKQVRQVTLLNLGRHFDLPRSDWSRLCPRRGVAGRTTRPVAETKPIEILAQRYAARLTANHPTARQAIPGTDPPGIGLPSRTSAERFARHQPARIGAKRSSP